MSTKPVALIYDFDKTLATSDMQNFKFIKDLGMDVDEFWNLTSIFSEKNHCERILSYLYVMIEECKKRNIALTEEYLMSLGQYVDYYEGVLSWFDRINEYGEKLGVEVEHYIISSGNREIIKGTKILLNLPMKKQDICIYVRAMESSLQEDTALRWMRFMKQKMPFTWTAI